MVEFLKCIHAKWRLHRSIYVQVFSNKIILGICFVLLLQSILSTSRNYGIKVSPAGLGWKNVFTRQVIYSWRIKGFYGFKTKFRPRVSKYLLIKVTSCLHKVFFNAILHKQQMYVCSAFTSNLSFHQIHHSNKINLFFLSSY